MKKKTNIFVIEDHKLVILGVPKCGQTSMKRAFLGNNVENVHDHKLLTYITHAEVADYEEKGYLTAGVARNPYDRIYSFWKQKVRNPNKFTKHTSMFQQGMPFEETVRRVCELHDYQSNIHFKSQSVLLTYPSPKGPTEPNIVGKLEEIDWLWDFLTERSDVEFGKRFPRLPHENRTEDEAEDPWTRELRELVYKRYEADFNNFGYER